MINELEEIRTPCECWWFNLGGNFQHKWHLRRDTFTGIRLEQEQRKDHCEVIKEFSETLQNRRLHLNRRRLSYRN